MTIIPYIEGKCKSWQNFDCRTLQIIPSKFCDIVTTGVLFVGAHYSKAAYSITIQIEDLVCCLSVRPSIFKLVAKMLCRGALWASAPYVTFSPNTFYYRNSLLSARMRGGTSVRWKEKTGTKVGTFPLPTFPFLSSPHLPTFASSSPSFDGLLWNKNGIVCRAEIATVLRNLWREIWGQGYYVPLQGLGRYPSRSRAEPREVQRQSLWQGVGQSLTKKRRDIPPLCKISPSPRRVFSSPRTYSPY